MKHPLEQIIRTGTGLDAGFLPTDARHRLTCHFDGHLLTRFEELTGHRLHVLWHEPLEFHDPARLPVLCPAARARLDSGGPLPRECAICQRDHWCPLAPATGHGRLLHGACGAHGFWAGVLVGPARPVTLVLHAADPSPDFNQAVKLLLHVHRKVETALIAEQARRELDQVLWQAQLPDATSDPRRPLLDHAHGPRATAVVQAMLDHLHTHYHRPLDLSDLAATLGMNASYLSSLFVSMLGVHFRRYLSEFRVAKAMELLRDPLWRISEVAAATGYRSPSHFNNVFKTMVGVSPSAWRDANRQADPPEPAANASSGQKSKES
ncbi:MAG: AraC family transcriptional regulator [Verrucomicrobia bacterium]|nr:AraC family transcriptional regulator [Verrucomicrobiota bacterium]